MRPPGILADAGRIDEAERLLRKGVDAGIGDAAFDLGLVLVQTGRVAEASPPSALGS